MRKHDIVLVTPARNEEKYLPIVIESIVNQTVKPSLWVIVDDGSFDNTRKIAEEAAEKYPFIKVLHKKDRGYKKHGAGVSGVHRVGINYIKKHHPKWDFFGIIDADVKLPKDYLERLLERFEKDPKLGIASGQIIDEPNIEIHPRGAARLYRRECFEQINRQFDIDGWDSYDEFKARSLGWKTRGFKDIVFYHLKKQGKGTQGWGIIRYRFKQGFTSGFFRYPLPIIAARALLTGIKSKNFFETFSMLYGYFYALIRGWKLPDDDVINYIKREQNQRMLPSVIFKKLFHKAK